MPAFFIATIQSIKDAEKFQEYAQRAAPTIAAAGGEIILRGALKRVIVGAADHKMAAVAQFPTFQALEDWAASPEYKAIIGLRDAGADLTIATYETPD